MRTTRVMAVVLGAVFLQVALARYAVGGRFAFDLVLVGVVFAALQSGAVAGMLAGTVGGLLQDVLSGGVIGVGGLVKTLIGYAAGALGTRFVVAKAHARAMIVALATIVHGLMAVGLRAVIDQAWPSLAWSSMLGEVAINAGVAWVAFQVTESAPGAVARGRSRSRSSWSRRQW
jgi:rod shape-determining protein MreD